MVDQSTRALIQELNTTIQDILRKLREEDADVSTNNELFIGLLNVSSQLKNTSSIEELQNTLNELVQNPSLGISSFPNLELKADQIPDIKVSSLDCSSFPNLDLKVDQIPDIKVSSLPNLIVDGNSTINLREANPISTGPINPNDLLTYNLKEYLTLLRKSTQSLQFETQIKADTSTTADYRSNDYNQAQNTNVTAPFAGEFKRNRINDPALGLEIYKTYRGLIEHENNLLNQRVNWFLASQTFLIAAVAAVSISYTFYAGIIIILISILGMFVSHFSQHNIILSLLATDAFNIEWKKWYYGNLQNHVRSDATPIIQPPEADSIFLNSNDINSPPNLNTTLKCFLDDSPGFTVQVKNMLPRQLLFNTKDTDQNFFTVIGNDVCIGNPKILGEKCHGLGKFSEGVTERLKSMLYKVYGSNAFKVK